MKLTGTITASTSSAVRTFFIPTTEPSLPKMKIT